MDRKLYSACKNRNLKLIDEYLDMDVGLNYIDENGRTPLSFLFEYNYFDQAKKYIEKCDKFMLTQKEKVKSSHTIFAFERGNNSMNELRLKIINLNEHEDFKEPPQIKKFSHTEFSDMSLEIGGGTYGKVYYASHATLGRIAIKKVIEEKWGGFLEEITYYKMINATSNASPIVYGFFMKNKAVYIVMEALAFTLLDIQKICPSFDDEMFKNYVKLFIKKICQKLYMINSIGICNNDIKCINVMIDFQGNVKIIDFGLAGYFGLNPQLKLVTRTTGTQYIVAPDADKRNKLFYDSSIHGYRTLNSDLYSVGVCVANFYFKTKYMNYIFKDGILYRTRENVMSERPSEYYDEIKFEDEEGQEKKDEEREYREYREHREESNEITKLICNMVECNPYKRLYADECFNQKMYGKKRIVRKKYTFERTQYAFLSNYSRITRELLYYNEMTNYNKSITLRKTKKGQYISKSKMLKMYNCLLIDPNLVSYTSIFNAILNSSMIISKGFHSDEEIKKIGICTLSIASYQIGYDFPISELIELLEETGEIIDKRNIVKYIMTLYENEELYNFIPVESCISSFTIKLQVLGYNGDFITEIMKKLRKSLMKWIIFNNKYDVNLYELIIAIYYLENEQMEQIDDEEYNEDLISKVSEILSIESRYIDKNKLEYISRV